MTEGRPDRRDTADPLAQLSEILSEIDRVLDDWPHFRWLSIDELVTFQATRIERHRGVRAAANPNGAARQTRPAAPVDPVSPRSMPS